MNRTTTLLCLLLASAPAAAQNVQRCEGADGKVTYANGPCTAGATAVRNLPPPPSPSAADRQAARQRAQQDARDVAASERTRKAEDERAAREQQQAAAKAEKREAHCRALDTRLRHAREDLSRAALKKRDEAERRARRAEEAYAQDCGGAAK